MSDTGTAGSTFASRRLICPPSDRDEATVSSESEHGLARRLVGHTAVMLGIRALGCRCPAWQGWWAPRTSDPGTGAARFMTAGSNPVDFQRWLFYAASFGLLWGLFSAFALGRPAGGAFISARLGAASSRPSLFEASDVAWGGVPVNAQERNLGHCSRMTPGARLSSLL